MLKVKCDNKGLILYNPFFLILSIFLNNNTFLVPATIYLTREYYRARWLQLAVTRDHITFLGHMKAYSWPDAATFPCFF